MEQLKEKVENILKQKSEVLKNIDYSIFIDDDYVIIPFKVIKSNDIVSINMNRGRIDKILKDNLNKSEYDKTLILNKIF